MKRPDIPPEGGTAQGAPVDPAFGKSHPLLFAFLTDDSWDDGGVRERSTLLVFCDGPAWKLCLLDRALARKAFLTGATLQEALRGLERALAEGRLDWRPDIVWNGRGGRGKKPS